MNIIGEFQSSYFEFFLSFLKIYATGGLKIPPQTTQGYQFQNPFLLLVFLIFSYLK